MNEGIIRVALIIRNLNIGGAERQVVNLAKSVDRLRISPIIILLVRDSSHTLLPEVMEAGVPVFISPHHKNDLRTILWLSTILRQEMVDVAHSFLWRSDATIGLVGMLTGWIPMICSERGDRSFEIYGYTRNIYDRLITFRKATRFCANSEFGKKLLVRLGCPKKKIIVIPNGVDLININSIHKYSIQQLYNLPEKCFIVGFVGRLEKYKGVETIIYAAQLLIAKYRNIRFLIVGDGPERNKLQALSKRLGINDHIVFSGICSPAIHLIKSFDIALSTSASEHCSNSILEYMACGKPVIATKIAGNTEIVIDHETGRLIPPSEPKALATAIMDMLGQPEVLRVMGEKGYQRVNNHFNLDEIRGKFQDLWFDVANNGNLNSV